MICVMNKEYDCKQMEQLCEYPKEYNKAIDTLVKTLKDKIPLCTWDSNCDNCEILKTQLACIIIGDLLDNGIQVKSGNTGIKTPVK